MYGIGYGLVDDDEVPIDGFRTLAKELLGLLVMYHQLNTILPIIFAVSYRETSVGFYSWFKEFSVIDIT